MKLMAENTMFIVDFATSFSIDEAKWQMQLMAENTIFIVDLANEFFHRWNQNGKWN